MAKTKKKAYSVKGKNGVAYFLHVIASPRYYFSKKIGKNSVEKKPEGFKVKKGPAFPVLCRI